MAKLWGPGTAARPWPRASQTTPHLQYIQFGVFSSCMQYSCCVLSLSKSRQNWQNKCYAVVLVVGNCLSRWPLLNTASPAVNYGSGKPFRKSSLTIRLHSRKLSEARSLSSTSWILGHFRAGGISRIRMMYRGCRGREKSAGELSYVCTHLIPASPNLLACLTTLATLCAYLV